MDIVGSEIGHKMRSAIKAKLTELGCYVDDELPDYVMVMVANKRTRSQMSDDLQLFLGTNTTQFVNWLHQVLKKLQEVTVNTSTKNVEEESNVTKEKASKKSGGKEKKGKEKKDKKASKEKHKKSESGKKSKKDKVTKKKDKEKKKDKTLKKLKKKKAKADEPIRPNVPPLLMNLEKDAEPSITDVFAGQILKNHGITLEKSIVEDTKALVETKSIIELKPIRKALKRNRFPIIDPETVSMTDSQPAAAATVPTEAINSVDPVSIAAVAPTNMDDESTSLTLEGEQIQLAAKRAMADLEKMPREDQIREMNEIEAKIQGLKKKLVDQMDAVSEDEDFVNIRTEAEELMNDFAEDVLQEISDAQTTAIAPLNATPSAPPPTTPPLRLTHSPPFRPAHSPPFRARDDPPFRNEDAPFRNRDAPFRNDAAPELPQIELQLPKRPLRERLGARLEPAKAEDRLTPERPTRDDRRRIEFSLRESSPRRLTSRVAVDRSPPRRGPASVVRVRPRPRAPAAPPALLMKAVADAHKSLLNVPPKPEMEPQIKRALVLPMRRNTESQNIVIQVQSERASSPVTREDGSDCEIDLDTESLTDLTETHNYKPVQEHAAESARRGGLSQRFSYVPSNASDSSNFDDDVVKIHASGNGRGPQFVVTLDGLDPNVFLANKLKTEGLADEVPALRKKIGEHRIKAAERDEAGEASRKEMDEAEINTESGEKNSPKEKPPASKSPTDKKTEHSISVDTEKGSPVKRKADRPKPIKQNDSLTAKKRKASPIVFDLKKEKIEKERKKEEERQRIEEEKKEKEKAEKRERRESAGSDITVTTTSSSHKYDALPSLPTERKRLPCRAFPACRFGPACQFTHPRCKFSSGCTRPGCVYSHPTEPALSPAVASHVVPVSTYKSITAPVTSAPPLCKYYPACAYPACGFLHPKACRYGRNCLNRAECNFYHHDAPSTKWKSAAYV